MAKLSRKTKWGIRVIVVLLLVYAGLRWFEYTQVYRPSQKYISWVLRKDQSREEVRLTTSDNVKLAAWFFPASTNSPRQREAILVCHGNGGNITYLRNLYLRLAATGASVLLFDYRGYGESEGRPSEEGTYRDAQAAYHWLRDKGIAATNIFIYGQSLGGGIASELALRDPVGGLILDSTFTSTTDVGAERFPWLPVRLLSAIKYDTHSKLPRLKMPVLIMHSLDDQTVPFHLAEINLATANAPKLFWLLKGGHASSGEECHTGVERFLSAIETARLEKRELKF